MAQHKSAKKRSRSALHRGGRNTADQSRMKTLIRNVRLEKEKEKAEAALRKAVAFLDKLAQKRVIHRNKASNQKSKLTKYVNALGKPAA